MGDEPVSLNGPGKRIDKIAQRIEQAHSKPVQRRDFKKLLESLSKTKEAKTE